MFDAWTVEPGAIVAVRVRDGATLDLPAPWPEFAGEAIRARPDGKGEWVELRIGTKGVCEIGDREREASIDWRTVEDAAPEQPDPVEARLAELEARLARLER